MKNTTKFFENKKLQFAVVIAVAAALIFGGTKIEAREIRGDVAMSTGALASIRVEAEKVKTARDAYFSAIGKGDGGEYDEYLTAAGCAEQLDTRLNALKNLRNDFQRLSGEIVMRERENGSSLPRGTIARELKIIEDEIRGELILNQSEKVESALAKIESAVADSSGNSAASVAASVDSIRTNLEKLGTANSVSDELDAIEEKLPYLSAVAQEITKTSLAELRAIVIKSEVSSQIRLSLQTIRQLVENGDRGEQIETELEKIERRATSLAQSRQSKIAESTETIRKLLNHKTLAEAREEDIVNIETEMETIMTEIFSENEVAQIANEELTLRTSFQQSTTELENCMTTNQDVEKCENELITWVAEKEKYTAFIVELQNTLSAKEIEAEAKLAPLQEQLDKLNAEKDESNFAPKLSAFLDNFNPTYLKASIGSLISTGVSAVTGIINKGTSFLEGGIKSAASALGIDIGSASSLTSSAVIFDGPGAIAGLQTFKSNYKGNSYGSAIGAITGWTNFVLPFVGVIAIAMIVYAGFLYLTAAGSEDQTKKAKNIIIWVVIGIILIFSAYAIVNTLLGTNSSGGGSDSSTSISVGGIGVTF